MTTNLFLEPLDVLYLRGNRLFQGAGAHGEALMPPWPSLAAGAIRSRMLADQEVGFDSFARGESIKDPRLDHTLGTPTKPGAFRIAVFVLARHNRRTKKNENIEPCTPLPVDVIVTDGEQLDDAAYLVPRELPLRTNGVLLKNPVLRTIDRGKPISSLWLNGDGWQAYLDGERITSNHLLQSSSLWRLDPRLGIALGTNGTTEPSALYTAETVALCSGVGFLVRIEGADGLLPDAGLLRLGGDGRGSAVNIVNVKWPQPDWERIEQEGRFRIVLTTPGIFPQGWKLPGCTTEGWWSGSEGTRAKLVAATVSRATVVSGWDLAKKRPKAAYRAVPAGSVYWLENLEGGTEYLRRIADEGLWTCMTENDIDLIRRAEGFNNVQIAAWPRMES